MCRPACAAAPARPACRPSRPACRRRPPSASRLSCAWRRTVPPTAAARVGGACGACSPLQPRLTQGPARGVLCPAHCPPHPTPPSPAPFHPAFLLHTTAHLPARSVGGGLPGRRGRHPPLLLLHQRHALRAAAGAAQRPGARLLLLPLAHLSWGALGMGRTRLCMGGCRSAAPLTVLLRLAHEHGACRRPSPFAGPARRRPHPRLVQARVPLRLRL